MSGTDSSPETADDSGKQRSAFRPTRGIDPPTSPYGPPSPPDFDLVAVQTDSPQPVVEYAGIAPQRATRPGAIAAIVAAIVAVLVVVLVLVVVGIGSLLTLTGAPDGAAPSVEVGDSGQSGSNPDPVDHDSDAGAVESSLQAMIDEYKSARKSGSLWATIPDTPFNRTAVSAFLYLLTDLKLAASFGADTSGYLEQADELEQKLLNEEPLGSDISITMSDRTFTYDGDTGEGGYTSN